MDARRRASARHGSRPFPAAIALALVAALALVGCGGPSKPTPPGPPAGVDLTVALDGPGSVTAVADGDRRSCAVDCTLTFAAGTDVVLSATGTGGSTFAGWSDGCAGAGSCTLTMDADAGVTARFREHVLTVHLQGDSPVDVEVSPSDSETGAMDCALEPNGACAFAYDVSVLVSVSVRLADGAVSDGLEGCTGSTFCVLRVDGGADVRLTVRHPPTATADAYDWLEDQTKTVSAAEGVLANDADSAGDTLKAVLDRDVTKGTLALADDGSFTYTPRANFSGSDNFEYHAVDAFGNASTGVNVQLTIAAANDVPVPTPQTLFTEEDTALAVTLTATDEEDDPITFAVVDPPAHGTLTGSAPTLTYTPVANFNGNDAFTFTASDAGGTSAKASVTIQVGSVGDVPVGVSDGYAVLEDDVLVVPAPGVLANDKDADANLDRAEGVTTTAHGTLDLRADGGFTYTPDADFDGSDAFTYRAVDADGQESAATTVTIEVTGVNDAPVASDSAETTAEDVPKVVALDATDVDEDSLTYTIVAPPAHGTLSPGPGATRTYTPGPNYNGPDTFTFKANDGAVDSNVATVTLTVTPVNDRPTADSQDVDAVENTPIDITLTGSDPEGDPLTFAVVSGPSHGTLTGSGATRTYTPAANYNGPDSFTFKVNDGALDSAPATVSISVTAVNDPPTADGQAAAAVQDTPIDITLTGSDVEGDTLTFEVATGPSHGALTGTGAARTYTPTAGYSGTDSFTFTVNDGMVDSESATVTISVEPAASTPSITPTALVVSNALLATTALARLPVGGGALSID